MCKYILLYIFIYFQFDDIITTRSALQCALSKKHRNDVIVKKWCSQSKITSLLIDITKEIALGNYSDLEKNQNLILLAFEPLEDGSKLLIFNPIFY